jgi:hypothetical protein
VSQNRTKFTYGIAHYYDPSTDQFLSVDPDVAETDQPYAFTGDDPLNATDPSGLMVNGGPGQLIAGNSAASAAQAATIQSQQSKDYPAPTSTSSSTLSATLGSGPSIPVNNTSNPVYLFTSTYVDIYATFNVLISGRDATPCVIANSDGSVSISTPTGSCQPNSDGATITSGKSISGALQLGRWDVGLVDFSYTSPTQNYQAGIDTVSGSITTTVAFHIPTGDVVGAAGGAVVLGAILYGLGKVGCSVAAPELTPDCILFAP